MRNEIVRQRMRHALILILGGLAVVATGCSSSRPPGMLGLRWGERATEAPEKLGLGCATWEAWPGMAPFEVCHGGPVEVYGIEVALVTLIRRGDALAGIQLVFKDCAAKKAELKDALARDLDLADENVEYRTWDSGEVVRIESRGTECVVTVTNAALGKAYQKHRLRSRGPVLGPR